MNSYICEQHNIFDIVHIYLLKSGGRVLSGAGGVFGGVSGVFQIPLGTTTTITKTTITKTSVPFSIITCLQHDTL